MKLLHAALVWIAIAIVPHAASAQWIDLSVPGRPVADAASTEAGRRLYEERCWFCHGEDGDGTGPVAEYLWPRPRDFTLASFKLRTTESGELPTDEDLFRTISLGIPGTAMPEWQSVLSAAERWQVIAYIKTFAEGLFEDEEFDPYQFVVAIGSPPDGSSAELRDAGVTVFEDADCWECHGQVGRGDGERAAELTDDWDFPVLPADLQTGWKIKGGSTPREMYLRLSTGLDGTPMPSYSETLSEDDRWRLAYYVSSLAAPLAGTPATNVVITAVRVDDSLPTAPNDPAWADAPEAWLTLSGQATFPPRWQVPAVSDLAVQVLYDASDVAFRLRWNDRFMDTISVDSALTHRDGWEADDTFPRFFPDGARTRATYPDGIEVMFPLRYGGGPALPHFVYGSAGQPVDLWRWQADRAGDPTAVELRGRGAAQPPEPHDAESQRASANATWADGQWTVVIRRPLATEDGAREVQLEPGRIVPIAFHVWEGANGETGLKMAVSSWYFLHLRESPPGTSYLVVLLVVLGAVGAEYGLIVWLRRQRESGLLNRFGITADPGHAGRPS